MSICKSLYGFRYGPIPAANARTMIVAKPASASRWRMKRRTPRPALRRGGGAWVAPPWVAAWVAPWVIDRLASAEADAGIIDRIQQVGAEVAQQHQQRGEHQ